GNPVHQGRAGYVSREYSRAGAPCEAWLELAGARGRRADADAREGSGKRRWKGIARGERETAAHGRRSLRRTRNGISGPGRERRCAQRRLMRWRIPGEFGAAARIRHAEAREAQAAQRRHRQRRCAANGARSWRTARRHGPILWAPARPRRHAQRCVMALSHGRFCVHPRYSRRCGGTQIRGRKAGRGLHGQSARRAGRSVVGGARVRRGDLERPRTRACAAANPHLIAGGAKIHKAQALRSLGVELGLPAGALEATIAEYNAALAADQSARLAPPRTAISYKPYPIKQPPYYALPLCAGITFPMGGIATDDVGRALNGQNVAIPGLYAAGCCPGGLDGGPNAGYVGGLAKSAAMGLRTADHLAALAHVR